MNSVLKLRLAILGAAVSLLSVPVLRSQTLNFNVDLNTAGLSADTAPFSLDFQLNYGNSALATSTAVLSNFAFTGGAPVGSPTLNGSASGNLTSGLTLTASSASLNNELTQQFGSGVTDIKFNALISEPGPNIGLPSEFTVSIFDNSAGSQEPIFTTAPDTESMLTLNLDASNTLADVDTFVGNESANGSISLSNISASATIPEPATTAALFGGAGLLVALGLRRFRQARMSPNFAA
jgi:hypothetical protein